MDTNSLAAVPTNPMAATSALAEPEPNAAISVFPAAASQDGNAAADTTWPQQKGTDQRLRSLEEALEELNSKLEGRAIRLQFDLDPETKQVILSLVNAATGEILRSMPSEAELRIAKMIVEFQGQAVNTTA